MTEEGCCFKATLLTRNTLRHLTQAKAGLLFVSHQRDLADKTPFLTISYTAEHKDPGLDEVSMKYTVNP